jgi:hypothetical protein
MSVGVTWLAPAVAVLGCLLCRPATAGASITDCVGDEIAADAGVTARQ